MTEIKRTTEVVPDYSKKIWLRANKGYKTSLTLTFKSSGKIELVLICDDWEGDKELAAELLAEVPSVIEDEGELEE